MKGLTLTCARMVTEEVLEIFPIVCNECETLLNAIETAWHINGRLVEGSEEIQFYNREVCPKCKMPLHLKRWRSIDYRDVDLYAEEDEEDDEDDEDDDDTEW